ncbi:MAG: M43 family zinc metalloprotease [Saprospiraceae bacterium]
MKSSSSRITTSFFLIAFSSLLSFSQTIDIGRSLKKSSSNSPLQVSPTNSPGANSPLCAFDAANLAMTSNDPHLKDEIDRHVQDAVPALAAGNGAEMVDQLLSIAVVVHVIHNGEPIGQGQNISDEQVYAQIAILARDYAAINAEFFETPPQWAGVNGVPNIEFCLASTDPSGNPTNGITRHNLQVTGTSYFNSNINTVIKPQTYWNSTKYMNVWVLPIPGTTASGGVVGVSNYPIASQIGTDRDGITIDYRWFGAPGFGVSGYRPLTHETGHFLGLPHTFDGNSCSTDDGIADTPNIQDATATFTTLNCSSGYPAGPVSCGNEAMYVNYMDYVNENCYTSFTQGQVNVMRGVLNGTSQGYGYGSRLSLVQNAPSLCALPNNDAGIVRIISPIEITCQAGSTVPVVTLRNFGQANLTSATVKYKLGNGPLLSYNWQGSLFPGENADVLLPAATLPDGLYSFTAYTISPNGMADGRTSNDTISRQQINYLALSPSLIESFEDENSLPSSEGIYALDIDNDGYKWQLNTQVSAFGQGGKSVVFNNFETGPENTLDGLITRHYDLTNIPDAILVFDVAYALKNSQESDSLIILVQTGCSQQYNQAIYWKGGATLATAPNASNLFTPTFAQWRTEELNLSSFAGESDISFAFINLSGGGNRLFLDNIRFGRPCSAITTSFDIVPNGCDPNGACTGSAQVFVENGHGDLHYQWAGQPVNYDEDFLGGLCAGIVSVSITDAFGCLVTTSATVPQSSGPVLSASSTPVTTYNGQNGTATISATTGTGPFKFSWNNGVQVVNAASPFSTINNLSPGLYSVTVADATGCTATAQVTVESVCSGFSVSANATNITCFGGSNGSITAMVSNGTSPFAYAWNNGQTGNQNVNLIAGSYSVTATDANNCPAVQSVIVTQPQQLLPNASATNETAMGLNDGTAKVAPTGGTPPYNVLWNTGSTNPVLTNLAPGDYAATVTDAAGCTTSASVVVQSVNCNALQISVSATGVSCFGANDGLATVLYSGAQAPVTFLWSNGLTSQSLQNLEPGNYAVTVEDGLGCQASLTGIIEEPQMLQVSIVATGETGPGLHDGTAVSMVVGGTPFGNDTYQYMWSNGASTNVVSALAPGTYSVTVTDANGCTAHGSAEVAGFDCFIEIILTAVDASCPDISDGMAQITTLSGGTPPFSYLWSNGDMDLVAENLLAGVYGVTASDANGCSVAESITIEGQDNVPPTALVSSNIQIVLDENGTATLDVNAVDNGSFDNCSQVVFSVSPASFSCQDLGEKMVTLTVTDANGNTASAVAAVEIVDATSPTMNCPINIATNACNGVAYAAPTASDNCGVSSLDLVEGFQSGEVFPLGETMVTWRATDGSGNSADCSFTVTVENTLDIAFNGVTNATPGMADGIIHYLVSGGVLPYTFSWSKDGQPMPGFDPGHAAAGNYSLLVTDAKGCTAALTDIVVDIVNAVVENSRVENILVYPNPTEDFLHVKTNAPLEVLGLRLVDVSGKVQLSEAYKGSFLGERILDVSGFSQGIYWLQILVENKVHWRKIAILHNP